MNRQAFAVVLAIAATVALAGQADNTPWLPVQTIPLPGVTGRIDHLAVDIERGRLYVAALGNNTVEVIDLRAGTVLRSLPGFHEPQGIANTVSSVAVANGGTGHVDWVDSQSLERGRSLALGDDADNVRYDGAAKRLYVGYGSGAVAAIDPVTGQKLGDVNVGGHPESFQLERTGTRIFVNVPGAGKIAVIDRATMKVITDWPMTGASSNYPMALDEAGHRLFVGCRRPAKVLVYDTQSGKVVGSADTVGDTDDLFYDASLARLYVIGGEGFVDVFQARAGEKLTRAVHLPIASGARTGLFVPEQRRLYLAVPLRGAQQAEIRVFEAKAL
jgi:DNA-binding beta-propeller fold protein YncE